MGQSRFAQLALNATQLQSKVTALRAALDPPVFESVTDIPNFDVEGAHELYKLLMEPVAQGWRDAKALIVVTNGALGLLPLSLLHRTRKGRSKNGRSALLRGLSQRAVAGANTRCCGYALGSGPAHFAQCRGPLNESVSKSSVSAIRTSTSNRRKRP